MVYIDCHDLINYTYLIGTSNNLISLRNRNYNQFIIISKSDNILDAVIGPSDVISTNLRACFDTTNSLTSLRSRGQGQFIYTSSLNIPRRL